MKKVVGIRFKKTCKIYYFDPLDIEFVPGDHVIVETARGMEYGTVSIGTREIPEEQIKAPLKPIIRKATPEDEETVVQNQVREREAFNICQRRIQRHGLEMNLVDVEFTFDVTKIIFYFTADGRIDFRELVKDLASVFRTRIELRQIGVRDEARMVGGIGSCGRPLCCASWLGDFEPVSIRMAKNQNLSLNPTKISGSCGRLMCCLKYEENTYEWLNSKLPNVGDRVSTEDGFKGEVSSVNVLRQQVKVIITMDNDEKEIREYNVSQLKFKPKRRRDRGHTNNSELSKLEALEKKEGKSSLE